MATSGRVSTPFRQRLRRARVGALPLIIWLVSAVSALKLWMEGPRVAVYSGVASVTEYRVTSPADGGLADLLVELYDPVDRGQLVAALDDTILRGRIRTARAELERLASELEANRATMIAEAATARRAAEARHELAVSTARLEYPAELRAFHTDEARLELQLLETRLAATTSALDADRLELRWERARALERGALGPRAEAEDLERRLGVERARHERLQSIEERVTLELAEARLRRSALEEDYAPPAFEPPSAGDLDARLAGWSAAIVVQRRRLEELEQLRTSYLLRAPATGRVAALPATEGQFVLAGEPVLVVAEADARDVTLWIPEAAGGAPAIGDRFTVSRPTTGPVRESLDCLVRSTSPRVEPTPQRLWRDPRVAEYGRACRLQPVPSGTLRLVPGERLQADAHDEPRP